MQIWVAAEGDETGRLWQLWSGKDDIDLIGANRGHPLPVFVVRYS
jgi:hypothetical protein